MAAPQDAPVAALNALYKAYIRLLEDGRNRIIDLGGTCDPIDVMVENDPALRAARSALVTPSGIEQAVRDARGQALSEAECAVDKELENGSPESTWDDEERKQDDDRIRALTAIRALPLEPEAGK